MTNPTNFLSRTGYRPVVYDDITGLPDLSSFVPYTGATDDVDLGEHTLDTESINVTGIDGAGFIELLGQSTPPTDPAAGAARLYAETFHGFTRIRVDNETGTDIVLSRDNLVVAKNTSGSSIPKGAAVYVSDSTGNVPDIALAKADSIATLPSVGIVLDTITSNNFGLVMFSGILSNIDTSAFTTGDNLWVSSTAAGELVNTAPTYPDFVSPIGVVLVSGVGNGSILVRASSIFGGHETGTTENWTGGGTVTAVGGFIGDLTGNADTVTTISNLLSEGTNITITGSGTLADPYVINSTGGGGTSGHATSFLLMGG